MTRSWKWKVSEDELRSMHVENNMSDAAIGRQLGVHPSTVRVWRNHFGIETRNGKDRQKFAVRSHKRVPRLSAEELRNLYIGKRMSDIAIGQQLGVNNITVANWRKKYGIRRETQVFHALPVAEIKRLYLDEKWTMEAIAKFFKCGESTVRLNIIANRFNLDSAELAERRLASNLRRYDRRYRHDGYWRIMKADHPAANRDGYVDEHRYLAEAAIGRYLNPGEQVHHINLKKLDNRIENLSVLPSKGDHSRLHKHMEKVGTYLSGLGGDHPGPFVFSADAFWAGKWVSRVDIIGKLVPLDRAEIAADDVASGTEKETIN